MIRIAFVGLSLAACSPAPTGAAALTEAGPAMAREVSASPGRDACARVDQSLIPEHEAELKRWIEGEVRRGAGAVTVQRRMEVGDWLAVWATPADREQGVYFIRRTAQGPRFLKPWGGMAAPEDRADVAQWARDLDPEIPVALADCFALAVTGGETQP